MDKAEDLQVRLDETGMDLDDCLSYLDVLRESGVTNMFGAGPYIREAYELDRNLANDILGYWMKTFGERHPPT